jgi:hypothetical protein
VAKIKPPGFGAYEHYEVISAFRKEVKLGRLENAIYWLSVMLEHGDKSTPRMVARQLWIMAAEDVNDAGIVLRAAAVYQMADVAPETDHLYYLTAAMCRAEKWWQTEEGREVDEMWSKALGDLKADPKPIPGYALDRHTSGGWAIKRSGGQWDDRFSGTDIGRAKTSYLYQRDGVLRPDLALDEGFEEFWAERQRLEAGPGQCLADEDD